jgi:putative phosphoribosyl transferase
MNPGIEQELDWQPNAPIFADRLDAGRQLGEELRLRGYGDESAVVIVIPKGGVPVGYAVAQAIGARLEVIIPRKLPILDDPEAVLGAITPDGTMVLNLPLIKEQQLSVDVIKRVAIETFSEIRRQMQAYCGDCPPLDLVGKTAILVDDGLDSGFTMLAAVRAIHRHKPARIVVAVPVSTFSSIDRLKSQVDDLIYLVEQDDTAFTVANCYEDFDDLTDDQVRDFLQDDRAQGQP